MSVELICETSTEVTYQVTISLSGSMLEAEEAIQQKLNEIGLAATQKKLEAFDTDGSPIVVGNKKFTSKGKTLKNYETLYGVASVERHVYQSNEGGKTFCPLDDRADHPACDSAFRENRFVQVRPKRGRRRTRGFDRMSST